MSKSDSIKSDIEILKQIARKLNEQEIINSLDEVSRKISSKLFYLVVVGLFKRGKSSVINALTGKELAPVSITPTTSVITFFHYAPETRVEVILKGGRHYTISPEDVTYYISEEYNPKNKKEVDCVRIFTNSPLLENLILVDTPGIGSLFSHNTATTIDFLPKIDAALFVMSADLPISQADEEILRQIQESVPKVVFVLNKSDLLCNEDLEKMVNYNINMLKNILNKSINEIILIPVSAREYFSSHKHAGEEDDPGNIKFLRETIIKKITGEKEEIITSRSIKLLLSFSEHLHTLLKVRADTLQMPLNELEKKRESMQKSIEYLSGGKVDFDAVVINRVQQLIKKVTDITENKRKELEEQINNTLIVNSREAWKKIIETDANSFSKMLSDKIIIEYENLKNELEESVKEEFRNILLLYSTISQSFIQEIVKQMKEVLGINIEGIISTFDMDVYSSFYFKTETNYNVPSIKKNIFYKILPEFIIKRKIIKQIYRNCIELINPNAGKMRSDLDYKISESYRKFKYNFDQKLFDLLHSLKKLIDESIEFKSSINQDIEFTLKTIKLEMDSIENIRKHYLYQ